MVSKLVLTDSTTLPGSPSGMLWALHLSGPPAECQMSGFGALKSWG